MFKTSQEAIDYHRSLQNGNEPSDTEVERRCVHSIIWEVEEPTSSEWLLIDEIHRVKGSLDLYKKNEAKMTTEIAALKLSLGMDKPLGYEPNLLPSTAYAHGKARIKKVETAYKKPKDAQEYKERCVEKDICNQSHKCCTEE